MNTAVLIGAYGRDYTSAEAAIADYNSGKDFVMCTVTDRWVGKACNKSDLLKTQYDNVKIRFNRKEEFVYLTLGGEQWESVGT